MSEQPSAENDAGLIEQILTEHASEQTWKAGGWAGDTACACGWRMAMWTRKDFPAVHRKHVAEQIAARANADEALMEPWGPFEMGGFEGCIDQDPAHCACATDQQPTCRICDQEIGPGEMSWARQWPCYDTLPLGHKDQEWDVISWHDECPDARVFPPESPHP